MKQYLGVKIIKAEESTDVKVEEGKGWPIALGRNPKDGYKVVYEDGYVSWSPKDVFNKAYRVTDGLTFGLAIEAMKMGKKVCRAGWNGKRQYIELATNVSYMNPAGIITNVNHEQMGNKAIAFVGTSGVQLGWLASQADMLSEDWMVVE